MNNLFQRIISSLILIFLSFFCIIKGEFIFNIFIFICFILSNYEWKNMSFTKWYYFPGALFLLVSFNTVYEIRNSVNEDALFIFFFGLIISIASDIGGFVFGKAMKGPKLIKISPNKTYAGVIGAYIFSILSIFIFLELKILTLKIHYIFNLKILLTILLLSTINQIGDLIISYFKRLSKIKDSGNIIPGHGGVLDRIDGMLFTFPIIYYFEILK